MEKLHSYIKSSFLHTDERDKFCRSCGTTWGYIQKIRFTKQKLRCSVCINFERESAGAILCEDLRPDVDWAYVRNSSGKAA